MTNLRRSAAAALAVASAAIAQQPDAQQFRQTLGSVASQLAAGDAAAAAISLAELLESHAGTDHARHARREIEQLDQRCRFAQSYEPPEPASLVSGTLRSLNLQRGHIDIEYHRDQLADFSNSPNAKGGTSNEDSLNERLLRVARTMGNSSPIMWHPAVFTDYRLTITGPAYSLARVIVGRTGTEHVDIVIGDEVAGIMYVPTRVIHVSGEAREELVVNHWGADEPPPKPKRRGKTQPRPSRFPMQRGEEFNIDITVNPRTIRARFNGRSIASVSTSKREPGLLGIGVAPVSIESVRIRGTFDPAWIQHMLDAARHAALEDFERTYDPQTTLPQWLFEASTTTADTTRAKAFPADTPPPDVEPFNRLMGQLNAGAYLAVLNEVATATDEALPPAIKAYLRAIAHRGQQQYDDCRAACDEVCATDSEFAPVRALRGEAYSALGMRDAADREFTVAIELDPSCAIAYDGYAAHALRTRRLALAQATLDRARAAGALTLRFEQLAGMVLKVRLGPVWPRKFSLESPHYRITSDIDEAVCRDAAKILEDALRHFQTRVGALPAGDRQRFQVYVFSGRASFDEYCKGLLGDVPMHTSGLYSPMLKQLLIWNQPNSDDTLRTIRHEGFHQYFDALTAGAPPWLHEGMAEYFEVSRAALGGPSDGLVQPRHVLALTRLRRSSQVSIDELLRMGHREFYLKAAVNYPLSWALVRHMRRDSRVGRQIIDELVAGLKAEQPYPEVLAAALAGVDLDKLQTELWESIEKMHSNL